MVLAVLHGLLAVAALKHKWFVAVWCIANVLHGLLAVAALKHLDTISK